MEGARSGTAGVGLAEDAHVRELLRASVNLLEAIEVDPALTSRTRLAAAGCAAALQRVAADWTELAREWRHLRRSCHDAHDQLRGLQAAVGELYRIAEEEWPSIS